MLIWLKNRRMVRHRTFQLRYAEQGRGSQAAHKQTVDELLEFLNSVCDGMEVKFEPFGSFMNGFGDTEANVDVAVTSKEANE